MGVPILVGTVIGFFQPESGWTIAAPLLLEGLASHVRALATLRQEYGIPRAWRPELDTRLRRHVVRGFGVVVIVVALTARSLARRPELVGDRLEDTVGFWFVLVGLPWILAIDARP